jgi:hypothetical protein
MGAGVGVANWLLEKNHTTKLWWIGSHNNFGVCQETARQFVHLQKSGAAACNVQAYFDALRNCNDLFGWICWLRSTRTKTQITHFISVQGCSRRVSENLTTLLRSIQDVHERQEAAVCVAAIEATLATHTANLKREIE